MSDPATGCELKGCECYTRGIQVGRRTVEDEVNSERALIALLATALADAAEGIRLVINPGDLYHFETFSTGLPLNIDSSLPRGTVHIARDIDPPTPWRV